MPILIDPQTAALNEVREKCVKAASLYEDAGDRVESADLATALKEIHVAHRQIARDLAAAIARETDELPKTADPEQIGLDRLAAHTAAALARDSDARLVANCLDADDEVLSALDAADRTAGNDHLPADLSALLAALRETCERAVRRLG